MKKGKIINHIKNIAEHSWESEFSILFDHSEFWPYNYLFEREKLYFNEDLWERGSYFFPLKDLLFQNTELFLETNKIVIALWKRGSFSWKSRTFMEIINIKNASKYRLYPDEVSLVYNWKTSVTIYYKKWKNYKKLELDIENLQKISQTSVQLSAFFKLYYNHTTDSYGRLVYKANSRSASAWYFIEENIETHIWKPLSFNRQDFTISAENSRAQMIDIWEASLTWEL